MTTYTFPTADRREQFIRTTFNADWAYRTWEDRNGFNVRLLDTNEPLIPHTYASVQSFLARAAGHCVTESLQYHDSNPVAQALIDAALILTGRWADIELEKRELAG